MRSYQPAFAEHVNPASIAASKLIERVVIQVQELARVNPHHWLAELDALVAARLSSAPRHQPVARRRGRQAGEAQVQVLPDRLFHIDIAEVRTEEGKLYLLVAINRTSKFAFVELHEKAPRRVAVDFLRHLTAALPYKVHTVLTDNGTHFTAPTVDG